MTGCDRQEWDRPNTNKKTGELTMKKSAALLTVLSTCLLSATANAYFIRPYISYSGSTIDGLEVDGATSRAEGYSDAFRSSRADVSLATGQMKLFVEANGPNYGATAQGVMGDTVTLVNGAGTTANFTWGLEATVNVDWFQNTLNSHTIWYVAGMAVYAPGVADRTNWHVKEDNALFYDFRVYQMPEPTEDVIDYLIDVDLSGDINLDSNYQSFDVFYTAQLLASGSDEWMGFTIDGEHTASAGLSLADGVTMTSASGVFLRDAPGNNDPSSNVPEPGTILLLGAGLASILGFRSRKRG